MLIRKFDGGGQIEDEATKRTPLVSAEWYPLGVSVGLDKQSIVHTAQSDEFTFHLGGSEGPPQGLAAVWFIYADFMGAKLPESWPKAPEFAGGILAYFEAAWDLKAQPGHQLVLRQMVSKRSTGFEWERWAPRTRAVHDPKITAKLSDLAASNTGTSRPTQSGEVEPGGAADQSAPVGSEGAQPPSIDQILPTIAELGNGWASNSVRVLYDPLSSPKEIVNPEAPGLKDFVHELMLKEPRREAYSTAYYYRGSSGSGPRSVVVSIMRWKAREDIRDDWGRDEATKDAPALSGIGEEVRCYQRLGTHNDLAFRRGTYLIELECLPALGWDYLKGMAVAIDNKYRVAEKERKK